MGSNVLNYQFLYLVNVMACEPIGINYLANKRFFLKEIVWPIVSHPSEKSLQKIAVAVF